MTSQTPQTEYDSPIQQAIIDADSPAELRRLYKNYLSSSAGVPETAVSTGNYENPQA